MNEQQLLVLMKNAVDVQGYSEIQSLLICVGNAFKSQLCPLPFLYPT